MAYDKRWCEIEIETACRPQILHNFSLTVLLDHVDYVPRRQWLAARHTVGTGLKTAATDRYSSTPSAAWSLRCCERSGVGPASRPPTATEFACRPPLGLGKRLLRALLAKLAPATSCGLDLRKQQAPNACQSRECHRSRIRFRELGYLLVTVSVES